MQLHLVFLHETLFIKRNPFQDSAQKLLETSWTILLPTPDERARALSSLLPGQSAAAAGVAADTAVSAGSRFMTDLLVTSLMADGGLKISLQAEMLT